MHLTPAPLFTDVHPGPEGGAAYWMTTSDGCRIRVGHWPLADAKGTVLMFPGRTEYIEKYAETAQQMAQRGFAMVSIDWRGQGLADRLLDDPRVGHVEQFTDYQKDVACLVQAADALDLPRPFFLLGHSMGGCIGLRALVEGLDVQAAAFTGPMWGIRIAPHMRPPAWFLGYVMPMVGQGHRLPPSTRIEPYVMWSPFEDNMLTTDRDMYDMMRDQLVAHPELGLGGPSFVWLREALMETAHLAGRGTPDVPCITYVGSNERIVHIPRIHERMGKWDNGRLEFVETGEHEVLMEGSKITSRIYDGIADHFLQSKAA
jgi:lysophospholipase